MKKENFEATYNIRIEDLDWKPGKNGLFKYAEIGQYTAYYDKAWGYHISLNGSVLHWCVDLSKYVATNV